MNIRIRIDQKGPLFEGKTPSVVQDHLERAITAATLLLWREVKARTPQGVYGEQGGLSGSIQQEVILPGTRGTPVVKGIVATTSKYGEVIEKGRRPGGKMPPAGILRRWLEVKLGLSSREANGVEFVVRRKIARKGFEGAHMFEKALDENWARIEAIFAAEGIEITRDLNG